MKGINIMDKRLVEMTLIPSIAIALYVTIKTSVSILQFVKRRNGDKILFKQLRKTYPDLTNIQYLHENIDINDWKYEGILVTLSDGTQKYCVVENDNGQFKTKEVTQEFYETLNALITKHAEINYGDYSRVKEYIERIIYNKPVTKDIVDIFIAKYNNVDVTLLDLVTKHLEEKLKNNECL